MPVLPRVVQPAAASARRSAVAGVAGLLLVTGLAGCSQFNAALGKQQAVVSFRGGTSTAERLTVRSACAKEPEVSPQPVPDLKKYPYALQQLTFTISKASDAQVATLEKCLQKFPAVAGVTIQDSSDTGS
jgi:hypothetical protein